GLARTLRNLLFKSRADNNFHYNDWLYGQDQPGSPARPESALAKTLSV
ncbi:MAG TPA: 3-hydroxybenzoate 6-hydroxylase, partial [Arthrobacter bacterium]|nr:3-hydroxybenzoate 6-hydroxylase [Arthrobacter sp.]